jgi:hypothetical protein
MTISFPHPNGPQIVVVLLVLGIVALFVYFHMRGGNKYSFLDTLVDTDGRASIGKHFAWIAAVLAVWLIMVKGGKDPEIAWSWAWQFLLTGLGYRVANTAIGAWANRPAAPQQPASSAPTIGQQVNVTAPDAEVPIVPTAARTAPPPPAIRVPR